HGTASGERLMEVTIRNSSAMMTKTETTPKSPRLGRIPAGGGPPPPPPPGPPPPVPGPPPPGPCFGASSQSSARCPVLGGLVDAQCSPGPRPRGSASYGN